MGRLILLMILMIIAFFLGFFIAKYTKSNRKKKQTNTIPKLSDLKGKKFKEYIDNLTKHLQ